MFYQNCLKIYDDQMIYCKQLKEAFLLRQH